MTASALPEGSSAGLLETLSGFVKELRAAGIPVSLTENLDAMEALRHIPLEDRDAFIGCFHQLFHPTQDDVDRRLFAKPLSNKREQIGPRQPLAEGYPLVAVDVRLAVAQLDGDCVHELLQRGEFTAQRRPRPACHWLPPRVKAHLQATGSHGQGRGIARTIR